MSLSKRAEPMEAPIVSPEKAPYPEDGDQPVAELGDLEDPSGTDLGNASSTLAPPGPSAPLPRRSDSHLHAAWKFIGAGLRDFNTTASLLPSSRFLVRSMLKKAPLEKATCVVELGPGVGTLTGALLKRLPPTAHLHAVELNEPLLRVMAESLPDPRLLAIHADACALREVLQSCGCGQADVIFSSLGLSMMPDDIRDSIVNAAREALAPGAPFVQYNYLHTYLGLWCRSRGFTRFDGWQYFHQRFEQVESQMVWRNVPPAAVFHCTDPRT